MYKRKALVFLFLLLLIIPFPSYAKAEMATLKMSDYEKGVVQVILQAENKNTTLLLPGGTGFFISDTGLIATAFHVYASLINRMQEVRGGRIVVRRFSEDHKSFTVAAAELVSSDALHDVALLKLVEKKDEHWKNVGGIIPLVLSKTTEIKPMTQITVVGYFGLDISPIMLKGNISGVALMDMQSIQFEEFLISISPSPGFSGGPAILDDGGVIGLISAVIPASFPFSKEASPSGLGRIVKCEHIQRLLDGLKK